MIEAGEVEETVKEEDLYLFAKGVAVGGGLAGGGFERDSEVSGVGVSGLTRKGRRSGKAEDIGGFVFAAEGAIEAAEGGVVGEQNFDFAAEANGGARTVEEARQTGGAREFLLGCPVVRW